MIAKDESLFVIIDVRNQVCRTVKLLSNSHVLGRVAASFSNTEHFNNDAILITFKPSAFP